MSEDESIFDEPEIKIEIKKEEPVEKEEVIVVKKKKKTRKREYTPEQRERMLANLKKGREASLKKRRAKKELKKEIKQNNRKVANDYVNEKLASEDRLLSKIDRLEQMINSMNKPKPAPASVPKPAPAPKPKPAPKPAPVPKPEPTRYVTLEQINVRRKPKSLKPKPKPIPKVINQRNLSTYRRKNKFGF
tara:strand:- start:420 stop:989 length:570 start_codon:yes stop_codon:yes gene_type:complete